MDIKTINTKIETLAKAEKITKAVLGELSRDLLEYVYINDSQDITPVNRLLSVLTPMNKRTSVLFFKNFLAWKFDDEAQLFTKKNKKHYDDKLLAVELFLGNEDNTIWSWYEANVKLEQKEIDWAKRLKADFTKALEAGITFNEIVTILESAIPNEEVKEAA